jgi:hypothetical protein
MVHAAKKHFPGRWIRSVYELVGDSLLDFTNPN